MVEASGAGVSTEVGAVAGNSDQLLQTRLRIWEKKLMRTNNIQFEAFTVRFALRFASIVFLSLVVGFLLFVAGLAGSSFAQESQPRTFSSPGEASDALFQAAQKEDEPALEAILGAGKEITSSSDEQEDKLEREQFSQKYQEMHRLVREPDGNTVLYIGAENWPFPIPLVSKNGVWYFDSETGKQEILFRRVGENETIAIEVCQEFAIAKNARVAKEASYDPITQFAESLTPADAGVDKETSPFHGYYFRRVTENSASATKGLTLVAYPAEYQSSGVMTFAVTRDGVVYQRDLGPSTTTVAPKIKAATGSGWHPAVQSDPVPQS
jgi:Protein of unknown function (DUF2950)